MKVKIWNYRNIPHNHPLELNLREGITFLLGINNAGKSNFINFFFDFREIFVNDPGIAMRGNGKYNIRLNNKYFDQLLCRTSEDEGRGRRLISITWKLT